MNVHTIVVGVDEGPGARRALSWLATAVKGVDANVIAVHCLPPLLSTALALPPLNYHEYREVADKVLAEEWCAPLRDAGTPHRCRVVEFEPAEGLRFVADEVDADLIVVGASERHGPPAPDTVPNQLLRDARRPVLVVTGSAAGVDVPGAVA